MTDVLMPRLSDSMEEGTIVKWLKSKGDSVEVGEELVEIETDKANMVYEADDAGTLSEILAEEGDSLAIGEPIARLGEGNGASGDSSSEEEGEDDGSGSGSDSAESPDDDPDSDGGDSDSAQEDEGDGSESGDGGESEAAEPEAGSEEDVDAGEAPAEDSGGGSEADEEGGEGSEQDSGEEEGGGSDSGDGQDEGNDSGEQESGEGRVKASPLARRIASEAGVELAGVSGSGPGGRILKADVEAAAGGSPSGGEEPSGDGDDKAEDAKKGSEEPKSERSASEGSEKAREQGRAETAKGHTEVIELTRLQTTIARRMAESKATAPHFYLQTEIDMSRCVAARAALKASAGEDDVVPSFNDMVVKACAIALGEFPRANGAYRDGKFEQYSRINVGIAVAGRDALVVPTIFDADKKGLREIAADAKGLARKVRDGKITPPELSGATFTVSNLGMYGVTNFHAVINSPQAGILAVGAIVEKPAVREGEITTTHQMGVSIACDHRILYGADGAQFLARVRAILEEPLGLAL